MTRTTNDVNMSNSERAHIANHTKADIFIRIHANSSSSSFAKGVLTMCQTEKNKYNGYLQQDGEKDIVLTALVSYYSKGYYQETS